MSPFVVLTTVWLMVVFLRLLPLINYQPLNAETVVFLCAGYLAFVVFYFSLSIPLYQRQRTMKRAEPSQSMINRLVWLATVFAVLGLVGAVVRGTEIYFLRGLDFSQGIASARLENIAQVEATGAGKSSLAGIARILTAFSLIAAMSIFIYWERIPARRALIIIIIFFIVLCLSILEGGRNTIAVNLLFLGSCAAVRVRKGKSAIPGGRKFSRVLKIIVLLIPLFFVVTFIERFSALGYDASNVMSAIERVFDIEINAALLKLENDIFVKVVASSLSIVIYVTHGINELNWLIQWTQSNPPALGAYNFVILAVSLQRMGFEGLVFDPGTLIRPGVYMTALGEFAIDFGLYGAIAICALLGSFFGYWWKKVQHYSSIGAELGLGIGIAVIIVSPLYSIAPSFLGTLFAATFFVLLMHAGSSRRSIVSHQRLA